MNQIHTHASLAESAARILPANTWEPSPHYIRFAIILVVLGSACGMLLLRLLEPGQPERAFGPAMLLLVGAAAWILINRGKTQATLRVMVFGTWLSVTGIVIFTGGLQAPIVVAFPFLILLAGWLIGKHSALLLGALTVIATALIIVSTELGVLPTTAHSVSALQGGVQIIVYMISAIMVTFLVHNYQEEMEVLRALGNNLVEQTYDLESGKIELNRAQAVAKVGNWIFDISQDFIRLSAETCRIFGLPEGTTGSHNAYLARVYSEDREGVTHAWQEIFNGNGFDHEHRIVVGDNLCWVRQKAEVQFVDGKAVRAEGITQDITERKHSEDKIHTLAFFDHLTLLPNRTLLLDRLKQMMAASERTGIYNSLLFLDLDHFKTLNDTRGHDIGDMLLKQTAQRLSSCLRDGDTVARFGGDEFVVILGNLSPNRTDAAATTELVAEKILQVLQQAYQLGGIEHHITVSVGATLFKGNATPIDDLLKQADLTMYKAKAAGRNTCCFFDPALETAVNLRAAMERNLRQAIVNQEFELHYQLQVAERGRLTGAEVLIRWHQPDHGLISPADFIPLAEDTGLIIQIGKWVLHTACTQLATWASQETFNSLSLAVNVSPQQFSQPDFVAMVLEVLASTGARADRLKLELTENLLVENVQNIIEKMNALKAKGVGFSLDDFGTGYSSLAYLKQLPLDELKIDQSFVRDILIDPNDATIAKTIVALAHSFELGVIAEGVETKAQLDALTGFGCKAFQGFFFSPPIPLAEFEQLILEAYSD